MHLRSLVYVLVLSCAIAPAHAEGKAEQKTEYMAIFMSGSKIGHAVSTRKVENNRVLTGVDMTFTLKRLGTVLKVRQTESYVETADGKPLAFRTHQDMGLMATTVEGKIDANGKLTVTRTSASRESVATADWPEGAMLSEGSRLYQLQKGLKEGTAYTMKIFECSMLRAMDAKVEVGAKAKVDLLGRVAELTEVKTTIRVPLAGDITTTVYVRDDMEALKTVTPMLGTNLEMVACTKEFAISEVQPVEFFDKFILRSPKALKNIAAAKSATYHLAPTRRTELIIPETDAQKVTRGADGAVVVTVRPLKPAGGARFPYDGRDEAAVAAMKPSRYVESDNKAIIALARRAVGQTNDAAEAVQRIEKFVRTYIKTKSLSVGYASAAEVAAAREGDCTEHAVLAAALCRAAGIPAQVVCGIAYVDRLGKMQNVFGPHSWARAYVGDKWISLDAAMPHGFDAGHIELASGNGDPEGFFNIVNTLGCFEIQQATLEQ
jgi:hypothetical protein